MISFITQLLSLGAIVCVLLVASIGAAIADASKSARPDDCQIGTSRFPNGEIVDIARSEGDMFRWRKLDGTTAALQKKKDALWTSALGWTNRPARHTASFTGCQTGRIEFAGQTAYRAP